MDILVALGVVILLCIIWLYRENKKDKVPKRSQYLFNALVNERKVTPEEAFQTLDRAGIEPRFLGESNL